MISVKARANPGSKTDHKFWRQHCWDTTKSFHENTGPI